MNKINTKKYLLLTSLFGVLTVGFFYLPLTVPIPNFLIKQFVAQCPTDMVNRLSCDPNLNINLSLLFIPCFILFIISGLTYIVTSTINYYRKPKIQ